MNYNQPFIDFCTQLKNPDFGQIINYILTVFIPKLCQEVGQNVSLTGSDKKQLVILTVQEALSQGCAILDKTFPTDQSWFNRIYSSIHITIPNIIDLLISVENKDIVFNPRSKFCLFLLCKK